MTASPGRILPTLSYKSHLTYLPAWVTYSESRAMERKLATKGH